MNAADIDLHTTLARSESLVHTAVEGDVTMMNIETGKYYGLVSVGARIWSCLDQPICVKDICHQLLTEYCVEPPRCEQEVLNFLRRMADEGVVRVMSSESR